MYSNFVLFMSLNILFIDIVKIKYFIQARKKLGVNY
jgi:hypothetical protein